MCLLNKIDMRVSVHLHAQLDTGHTAALMVVLYILQLSSMHKAGNSTAHAVRPGILVSSRPLDDF